MTGVSKESELNQLPEGEPVIEPWLLEKLDPILERLQAHEQLFDQQLLRLIGLMSVRFNLPEMNLSAQAVRARADAGTSPRRKYPGMVFGQ